MMNLKRAALPEGSFKRQSQAKEIWRRFCKSKGAVIGLVVLVLLAAIIGLMICAFSMDTANSPAQVLHLMLTLALVSVTSLVMIGVLLALLRRMGKGEIDNAKKH